MRKANWAIEKVTSDMGGRFAFNTAIAAIMELVNEIYRHPDADPAARRSPRPRRRRCCSRSRRTWAPRSTSSLTGRRVWEEPWPAADPAMLQAETFELVCQVNGKVRDRVSAPTGAAREELERLCLETRGVRAHVDGHEIAKVIVVPGKLVNVVLR